MVQTTPPLKRRRVITGVRRIACTWVRRLTGIVGDVRAKECWVSASLAVGMAKLRWLLVRKAVLRSIAGSFPAVALLGAKLRGMLPIPGANAATIPRE